MQASLTDAIRILLLPRLPDSDISRRAARQLFRFLLSLDP